MFVCERGGVEQSEGGVAAVVGERDADAVAQLVDRAEKVGRERVTFIEEQRVDAGGGAEAGAGVVDIGGAQGGLAVGVIEGDFAEGAGDFLQVLAQEMGEDGVDIGEVFSDGGGGHAHGVGEAGYGEPGAAVVDHDGFGGVEDAVLPVELARGEGRAEVPFVVDAVAVLAGLEGHGREDRKEVGRWASFLFRALYH